MSKKTVTFKMHVANTGGSENQPSQEGLSRDEFAALSLRPAQFDSEPGITYQSDRWVEHRDAAPSAENALTAEGGPLETTMMTRVILDVAAERSFNEVIALTFIVPPLLGWFWLFNMMNGVAFRRAI